MSLCFSIFFFLKELFFNFFAQFLFVNSGPGFDKGLNQNYKRSAVHLFNSEQF